LLHAPVSIPAPGPGGPHRFHLLFICLLVVGAGNSMLFALLPPLMRRLELPDSSVGWIFALSALLWAATSPFWGRLSDRTGRKPIIAAGLGAYAVSMGLFALVMVAGLAGQIAGTAVFMGLMLSRAVFGAFGSAASPAAQAYIADHTSVAQRTEELAALTAAFALGQAIGPALCAALAAELGLVFPIALVAGLAACASFAIWRYLPERGAPPQRAKAATGLMDSVRLAADPRLAGYLIFGLGLSLVTGTLAQVFGLFVMDRLKVEGGAGAEFAAGGFMVQALALMATQMAILPRLQLGPRPLMALGAALISAGIIVQIAAPSFGALLAAQLLQGLGFGLARPGFTGGASMAVRPDEQGAAAGLVVAVNGAGFIFSPLAGGVAYELIGMNTPLVISLATLAAMFAFALLSRRLRAAAAIRSSDSMAP
jgi:MFS family permease